jgi:hypothetical protein
MELEQAFKVGGPQSRADHPLSSKIERASQTANPWGPALRNPIGGPSLGFGPRIARRPFDGGPWGLFNFRL